MFAPRHGMIFATVLAAGVVAAGIARAQAANPKLDIAPAAIKLGQGESTQVVVIARNPGSTSLRVVAFAWVSNAKIVVTREKGGAAAEPQEIPPGASVYWLAQVARPVDGPDGGAVTFRLDYRETADDKKAGAVAGFMSGALDVQDRPAPSLDKVLEVKVESALKLLQEHRPGIVYVVVKNKETFPITVRDIVVKKPAFVEWTKPGGDPEYQNVVLAPRQERAFAFPISATNAVPNGKYLVLFEVQAAWKEVDVDRFASIVAKHEFDVGVLGESEILKLVDVPTFLLVPGFLIVVVFSLLWNCLGRAKLDVNPKNPAFWTFAILLSMCAAIVYPWWTGRNYLDGYGLGDIVRVWFGSVGAAFLGWVLAFLFIWSWDRYREYQKRQGTFSEQDKDPKVLLRKLAQQKRGLRQPQVDYQIAPLSAPERAVMLQADGQYAWIAPFVTFAWAVNADQELRAYFNSALLANEPKAVADLIDKMAAHGLTVGWRETHNLRGVTRVPMTTLKPVDGDLRPVVEMANP